jgi:hypothetical protein
MPLCFASPPRCATTNPIIDNFQVIAAFILSAMMTLAAIIHAYLSDSMPKQYLTETDDKFIADAQAFNDKITVLPPFRIWSLFWVAFWKLLSHKTRANKHAKLSRGEREEAVTRFILALSDQQLVVGLAILVAAIANQNTLTVSEFRIAFALTWFSATTHLATLDSLRDYFHRHQTVRNWRVGGMLVLLVLFLYCFTVIVFVGTRTLTLPVLCYFHRLDDDDSQTFYGSTQIFLNISWAVTSVFLLSSYADRILKLYGFNSNGLRCSRILSDNIKNISSMYSNTLFNGVLQITMEDWKAILDDTANELWTRRQRSLLHQLRSANSRTTSMKMTTRLKMFDLRCRLSGNLYRNSLLPAFPSLALVLTYGFVQLIVYRWILLDAQDVKEMGFGQITPLFMLVLPVLTAAEIYHGELRLADLLTQ